MIDFFKKTLTDKQFDKIKELKNVERFPVYKDLEPYKKYEFDIIDNVHQDIILIITSIKEIYKENELVIKDYKKQLVMGINIDNYIINQQFINNNLFMRNELYENYLTVYHNYHHELLNKYYQKLQLFFNQINHHIVNDVSSTTSSDDESSEHNLESPKNNINFDIYKDEEINKSQIDDISQNILISLNKETIQTNNDIEEENVIIEQPGKENETSMPVVEAETSESTIENSNDQNIELEFQPVSNKKKRRKNKKK